MYEFVVQVHTTHHHLVILEEISDWKVDLNKPIMRMLDSLS